MPKESPKKKAQTPYWRPDFRIADELPDIKVVRTDFLINFVVVFIVLALLALLGYREVRGRELGRQIDTAKEFVAERTRDNQTALRANTAFRRESEKINDIERFINTTPDRLAIFTALAESCPENIALERVSISLGPRPARGQSQIRNTEVRLTGVLRGGSAEALRYINAYRQTVESLPVFVDRLERVTVSQPRRRQPAELFEFSMTVVIKP